MANRIWLHHFGRGIVNTPNDFGAMGEDPTHPELLDWLASEFVARGWSMKALHRLIVTSGTYRQASIVDPRDAGVQAAVKADPTNSLLWKGRRQRLEGEAIRDAMLMMAHELNGKMFGISARTELPDELMESRYSWDADTREADRNRRSIYVLCRRNMRDPLLAAFDPSDLHNSCPQRTTTVTATQALTLLNSEFSLTQARRWSAKLLAKHGDRPATWIGEAYQAAYGRQVTADELRDAVGFLHDQADLIRSGVGGEVNVSLLPEPFSQEVDPFTAAALVDFCHALLNSNEFLFVD